MVRQRAIPTGEGWMMVVRQHNNKPDNNSYQPPTLRYNNNNRAREQQVLHQISTPNWSELPNDVLGYLIGFLLLPDYYRFGAVCRNWCTVAREKHHRPAQQLPWLVLGEDISTKKRIFFNISDNKHYYIDIPELHGQFVCGSSFGWLFTVDDALNIRILNPFTRKSYNLPPIDFGHEYFPIKLNKKWLVHKVILDHDPNERSNFTVIIVLETRIYHKVAFWKQGDSTWTSAVLPHVYIKDIIFFKGQFYAVGFDGGDQLEFFVVDVVPDLKLIPLQHHVPMTEGPYKSLVDLNGELLLLQWREVGMYIRNVGAWKLDFEKGIYSKCKHFNNDALFIGNNSAVVIDPRQISGCTENAIYFTHTVHSHSYVGWNCIEIYSLVKNNSDRHYSYEKSPYDEYVAPIWLAPNLSHRVDTFEN